MYNTPIEPQQESRKVRQKSERNPRIYKVLLTTTIFILSLALWSGLLYGGYYLAEQYIEDSKNFVAAKVEQIENLNKQQENNYIAIQEDLHTKLEEIHTELGNVKGELAFIQEDLALTGETISGTDKTKQALQVRIDELNKQLNELQTSIQRLEDAAK